MNRRELFNKPSETTETPRLINTKAYGLVSAVAIAGAVAVVGTAQVSADETDVATEPVTEVVAEPVVNTDNPATNYQTAQPVTPQENLDYQAQAETNTGALVTPVETPTLDNAVEQAQNAGVEVTQGGTVVHDTLEEAQADEQAQVQAIEQAEAEKVANNEAVKKAKEENAKIEADNKAEQERVAQENANIDKRNEAGQKSVDERNANAQKAYEERLDLYNGLVSTNEAIEAENKKIREENAKGQKEVDDYNKAEQERYEKEVAKLEADKKAYSTEAVNKVSMTLGWVNELTQYDPNLSSGLYTTGYKFDNNTGEFYVEGNTDDGVGVIGHPWIKGKVNLKTTYNATTDKTTTVITSVTVQQIGYKKVTNNRAAAKRFGITYYTPDGKQFYQKYHEGASSYTDNVNYTYQLPQTITLQPNQGSQAITIMKDWDDWVLDSKGKITLILKNTNKAKDWPKEDVAKPNKKTFTPTPEKPKNRVPNTPPTPPTPETFTPEKHIEAVLKPYVEVPEVETIKADYHKVAVKDTPAIDKDVVNEENISVDGQLVSKGSEVAWVLNTGALKAGREKMTSITLSDPLPTGFVLDRAKTAQANADFLFAYDETGKPTISFGSQAVAKVNADTTTDYALPQLKLFGTVTNDGATYKNTYSMTLETESGKEYTVHSDTPVVYTPGSETRTYNGNVVVRYFDEATGDKISPNQTDLEDSPVGTSYDTTDHKEQFIAHNGNTYELTEKVVGQEQGKVSDGTTFVDYYYKLVELDGGNVVVHYEDEDGHKISNDVVDTPDSPIGTEYDTTDNKPEKIVTEDGVEFELVVEKTRGDENGKISEGTTEVTYVYKRITPKPKTPTPTDNLIKPTKDVVDENGNSINGKSVLSNQVLNYVGKQDLDQYKGMTATKSAIAKGFAFIDDYLDEALDGASMVVKSIMAGGQEISNLLTMYHVLSQDTLSSELQEMVKNSGISPVGEFYMWVANNPEDFYTRFVQQGLDVTYNLSFKIKETFTEGDIENTVAQIDFGNGYVGDTVVNNLPKLSVHKDILNAKGESVDGKEVKLGDTATYKLEGWVIPADRGYDVWEYRFVDMLDVEHDEYQGFTITAKVDITLADGTVIKAGDDLKGYTETVYDAKTGKFETRFTEEFLASIPRTSEFGADALVTVKRIKAGEVVNEYTLYVNGNPVVSNKVVTRTPEPEKPEKPVTPQTPTAPLGVLPQTGDDNSDLLGLIGLIVSLATAGYVVSVKRKEN